MEAILSRAVVLASRTSGGILASALWAEVTRPLMKDQRKILILFRYDGLLLEVSLRLSSHRGLFRGDYVRCCARFVDRFVMRSAVR